MEADEPETHTNRQKVSEALSLLPYLAATGAGLGWDRAHLLARVSPLTSSDVGDPDWWRQELATTAKRLAQQPLVLLGRGRTVPAVSDGEGADDPVFPLPLLTASDTDDEPFRPVWSLMNRFFSDVPPESVAVDWQAIVRNWKRLGVDVRFSYTIDRLVADVRNSYKSLADLAGGLKVTDEEAVAWLHDLLAVMAGHHARHRQFPHSLLTGILPNQHGVFQSPQQVARDQGIDGRLKDIAQVVDPKEQFSPARAQLLHQGLSGAGAADPVAQFLMTVVQKEQTQENAIDVLVAEIGKLLPLKSKRSETDSVVGASIDLLDWFAEQPERYSAYARRIPLLSQEGTLQAPEEDPAFLLPLSHWDERAKPYQAVFPKRRLLAAAYGRGQGTGPPGALITALVTWRIAHKDLLALIPCDLEDRQVAVLLAQADMQADHEVVGLDCSTLPFLNEVMGATAQDRARASLLLGLVLKYVIHQDTSWREPVAVPCSCSAHEAETLHLYPSEWLAALLLRNWIASEPDKQGESRAQSATRETLDGLINWSEALAGDLEVQFLSRLGFDALDLNIRRQAGGIEESTRHLRQQVADLVAAVGAKPETYATLIAAAHERARRQEMIRRNQVLGLHVQNLVRGILLEVGFDRVTVRHRGRDLEAQLDSDLGVVDVGPFSFEVKASQEDEVKMSPAQAEFAVDALHRDTRVLCVVDLRDVHLPENLTTLDARVIDPVIFIVDDIGQTLLAAYQSVQQVGSGTDKVRVGNFDGVLYCVQRKVWECAPHLRAWVGKVKERLANEPNTATGSSLPDVAGV